MNVVSQHFPVFDVIIFAKSTVFAARSLFMCTYTWDQGWSLSTQMPGRVIQLEQVEQFIFCQLSLFAHKNCTTHSHTTLHVP